MVKRGIGGWVKEGRKKIIISNVLSTNKMRSVNQFQQTMSFNFFYILLSSIEGETWAIKALMVDDYLTHSQVDRVEKIYRMINVLYILIRTIRGKVHTLWYRVRVMWHDN